MKYNNKFKKNYVLNKCKVYLPFKEFEWRKRILSLYLGLTLWSDKFAESIDHRKHEYGWTAKFIFFKKHKSNNMVFL